MCVFNVCIYWLPVQVRNVSQVADKSDPLTMADVTVDVDVDELAQRLAAQWVDKCVRRGRHPRAPSAAELATVTVLVAAIRAGPPGSGSTTVTRYDAHSRAAAQLIATIESLDRQMDRYENPRLLDDALEHIPLQELHEKADALQSSGESLPCFEDALAEVLVRWFRDSFFVWIDRKTEKCPVCGINPLKLNSTPSPTAEEKQGGASRVEVFQCTDPQCPGTYRFPRYNDLSILMRTRVGRCGEFANVFTLFLRAMGLRAQYVWNREDHVWNAYYSPAQERWIHLDSCEAARNKPLLYSKGWGKRMSYCLAFSCDGAMDVSRGYIRNEKWVEACLLRNLMPESDLFKVLKAITAKRRMGRSTEAIKALEHEDAMMEKWLLASDAVRGGEDRLDSRQSGNSEWKESRGEAGPNSSSQ